MGPVNNKAWYQLDNKEQKQLKTVESKLKNSLIFFQKNN